MGLAHGTGAEELPAGTPRTGPRPQAAEETRARTVPRRRRETGPLMWVAAAFVVAQLLLIGTRLGVDWDESVYLSQVSPHAPASFFSAPRARGVSLLVAPVASWSDSTALLRGCLAALSGVALFLALRAWRGLFAPGTLALAGALFASLWVTLFYGSQAMPNYWVAIGALLAVGSFLRAASGGRRAHGEAHAPGDVAHREARAHGELGVHSQTRARSEVRAALWWLGAGAALMALMRPTDAVWVTLPLAAALVRVRRGRRARLAAYLVCGLLAGAAEWIAEAYVRYGGPCARLREASSVEGGLAWKPVLSQQLLGLDGRLLCRPCEAPSPHPLLVLWWFLLPLTAAAGIAPTGRRRRAPALLALSCAITAAAPYLLLVGYAAPRFLLPAYALAALPAALALTRVPHAFGDRRRPALIAALAVMLAGHLAVQLVVLERAVVRAHTLRGDYARAATQLHRMGVRPPCLVVGHQAIPIGFHAGCASGHTEGPRPSVTPARLAETARHEPVAVLTTGTQRAPRYAASWAPHEFSGMRAFTGLRARTLTPPVSQAAAGPPTTLPRSHHGNRAVAPTGHPHTAAAATALGPGTGDGLAAGPPQRPRADRAHAQ
ncbi:hypothetical protein [Streptomyces sp. ODS28]|uniref:hypothetical protein n=1 Tax=Streptomyces sp. ODS28 TaxID=3136688 RepID=UPI0031EBF58B